MVTAELNDFPCEPDYAEATCLGSECADETLRRSIQLVLRHTQNVPAHERRRDRRYPFPYPIRITPVDADGVTVCGDEVTVLGRHLTERGVDFYYHEPIPYRWVLATFEQSNVASVSVLLELTWCRFGHHGYYENGGRFLRRTR